MPEYFDQFQGIIFLTFGTYLLLVAYGIAGRKKKRQDIPEQTHAKLDKIMKVAGPIIIIYGILLLLGILS